MYAKKNILLILLSISLFSCTKDEDSKNSIANEDTVKVSSKLDIRATERWKALISKDWEKAYSYQTPNYRKTYTAESFRYSFGDAIEWKDIKFISINKPSKGIADVKLELTILYTEPGFDMRIPSVITERWQLIDNNWWNVKD